MSWSKAQHSNWTKCVRLANNTLTACPTAKKSNDCLCVWVGVSSASSLNICMCPWITNNLSQRSAIVSNVFCFGAKFATAMFHQCNCLCVSKTINSWEITLRCILTKSTAQENRLHVSEKKLPASIVMHIVMTFLKIQMTVFLCGFLNLSMQHHDWCNGTSRTWHSSVKHTSTHNFTEKCGIDSPCNRNHLSAQVVSKRFKSLAWLWLNHG